MLSLSAFDKPLAELPLFSKTDSKNCFCYLVKFFTAILYLLILLIFKKILRFFHPNEAHGNESEHHEEEINNNN